MLIKFKPNLNAMNVNVDASAADGSKEKFNYLSNAGTSLCAGPSFIDGKSNEDNLQGACCSAMDLHRYQEQVEGLKKYAGLEFSDVIPSDPYDIPVSFVRELLDYQKNIQLTAEQQATYDKATKLSDEGGPCCCKCWRWDAFEGQAKYLITKYNFNAEQIAELWDIEDGCGGKGHEGHGEMMEREIFEPTS